MSWLLREVFVSQLVLVLLFLPCTKGYVNVFGGILLVGFKTLALASDSSRRAVGN